MAAADVILSQLGGAGRLKVMIGAREFYSENNGQTLYFKFAMCPKANVIKITLNGSDLYDVEFWKRGRLNTKTMTVPNAKAGEFSDVYAEDLKEIIENYTGLYLSMGRVV